VIVPVKRGCPLNLNQNEKAGVTLASTHGWCDDVAREPAEPSTLKRYLL
jgi:hypothetical protein